MTAWQTIVAVFESVRTWSVETGSNTLMFQASAAVLIVYLIRNRGRFAWPREAFDSTFSNILLILLNGAFAPVFVLLMNHVNGAYAWLPIPSLAPTIWNELSPWLSILLALLAIDFADYWNHRLMHASKWLWPIHSIHHSDPHPTVLTVGRVHLLEPAVMQVSYLVLLAWLSLPPDVLASVAGLRILHNMYIHMNVDWDHGPFKYLIASPRYHRWHHANEPAAFGMNLANHFPIYDLLFGTYYVPGTCRAPVGAQGVPIAALPMVVWPFLQWYRLFQTVRRADQADDGYEAQPSPAAAADSTGSADSDVTAPDVHSQQLPVCLQS